MLLYIHFNSKKQSADELPQIRTREMRSERNQGSCMTIRCLPTVSVSRYSNGSSSSGVQSLRRTVSIGRWQPWFLKDYSPLAKWQRKYDVTCGSPRWIGRGLSCVCIKRKGVYERVCVNLTPSQEERLNRLKHRMNVYFDPSRHCHQEALRALWASTYPNQELHGLISEQWKQMGWQGKDPSTDFRGGGFISLENLLFFAKTFSGSFQRLLNKQGGKRAAWEYPFAVAGVNITFMIMQMLDLHSSKSRTFIRTVFIQMLAEDEWAFDLLYCVAFMIMDKQWIERNASYMEFNEVLRSTRIQLEKELLLDDVMRIEDMPSYGLLS